MPCEYRDTANFSSNALAASRTNVKGTLDAKCFHSTSAFSSPVLFRILVHFSTWHWSRCSPDSEAAAHSWRQPCTAGTGHAKTPVKVRTVGTPAGSSYRGRSQRLQIRSIEIRGRELCQEVLSPWEPPLPALGYS